MNTRRDQVSVRNVFRIFIVVRLVLALVSGLSQLIAPVPISRFLPPPPYWTIIESILVLAYLYTPWLERKSGSAYLPLALAVVSFSPLFESITNLSFYAVGDVPQIPQVTGRWQFNFLMLIPLILISWMYGFKVVSVYTIGFGLMDIFLSLPPNFSTNNRLFMEVAPVSSRTLLFLLIGYVVSRLVNDQRRQTTKLEQANRKLASYATTLEQLTISRERNRMGRELHDTLAHTLSAVAVQLEAVGALWQEKPQEAHDMLNQSLEQTRKGLNETRRTIHALRATPLEDLGLLRALTTLARTTAERNGLTLQLACPEELPGLPADVEHSLYRIAEETMRNVTQHAQAHNLQLILLLPGNQFIMEIYDDGRGFEGDENVGEGHFGLKVIRERAESIGAQLTIFSRPLQGTRIHLEMELPHDTHPDL